MGCIGMYVSLFHSKARTNLIKPTYLTTHVQVIHDVISVSSANTALDTLMRKKPIYSFPQLIFLGGMCSSSICSVSFNGSFIDSLVSFPLGALLVTIQLLSVRNELYGNVFEITVATLLSFVSAALASTKRICYEAVASSSVVLILPVSFSHPASFLYIAIHR
jgi:uncharacterized membrane protein YjjP (DUF1212 family)